MLSMMENLRVRCPRLRNVDDEKSMQWARGWMIIIFIRKEDHKGINVSMVSMTLWYQWHELDFNQFGQPSCHNNIACVYDEVS